MSISSMANAALARRTDFPPFGSVPRGLAGIAAAADTQPVLMATVAVPMTPTTEPSVSASGGNAMAVDTALHVVIGYVPTEILTLYVAVLAAIQKPAHWTAFWIFLVATPIVVWLVYGAKLKAAQKVLPWAPRSWPLWEMFAATVAYCVWAFGLPNAPFADYSWYSSALAGIAVLVASTILGLLAPFCQRPLGP